MSVGIDCGGRKIAVVSASAGFTAVYEVKPIDYVEFYTKAPMWLRGLIGVLKELGEEDFVVESPIVAGARNLQATIKVAQTVGLVHAVIPNCREVAVSSWKKAVVGRGNVDKAGVRQWLDTHHPELARLCDGNQDLYDAACISLYGDSTAA